MDTSSPSSSSSSCVIQDTILVLVPKEIFENFIAYLEMVDLLHLARTCKQLHKYITMDSMSATYIKDLHNIYDLNEENEYNRIKSIPKSILRLNRIKHGHVTWIPKKMITKAIDVVNTSSPFERMILKYLIDVNFIHYISSDLSSDQLFYCLFYAAKIGDRTIFNRISNVVKMKPSDYSIFARTLCFLLHRRWKDEFDRYIGFFCSDDDDDDGFVSRCFRRYFEKYALRGYIDRKLDQGMKEKFLKVLNISYFKELEQDSTLILSHGSHFRALADVCLIKKQWKEFMVHILTKMDLDSFDPCSILYHIIRKDAVEVIEDVLIFREGLKLKTELSNTGSILLDYVGKLSFPKFTNALGPQFLFFRNYRKELDDALRNGSTKIIQYLVENGTELDEGDADNMKKYGFYHLSGFVKGLYQKQEEITYQSQLEQAKIRLEEHINLINVELKKMEDDINQPKCKRQKTL